MSIRAYRLFLLLVSCCFLNVTTYAQDAAEQVITITQPEKSLLIRSGTYFFEDKSKVLTAEEVVQSRNWQLNTGGVPNFGVTRSAYWIRLLLENNTDQERLILKIASPILDQVELYDSSEGTLQRRYITGEAVPAGKRTYASTDFLMPVRLPMHQPKHIYLRVINKDNLQVPIFIGNETVILRNDKQKDFFWAVFIGLILSTIVYNLFISISVQDRSYLIYVLYLCTVLFTQISIQGYTSYLWPNLTWLNTHLATIMPALVGIGGVYFMRDFLHTKTIVPKLDRIFRIFIIAYLLSLVLVVSNLIYYGFLIAEICAATVASYMMYVAFRLSAQGYRTAKFFSVAWGIFLVGIVFYTLKDYNIFPYNNFTLYTMPVGSALEAILLSFALADKINVLKKEKAISQAHALREAQKNAQLIQTQNQILETKVQERTQELNNLNDDLKTALDDLKGAQAQLVESEKMASLGQLTAGIAHEINNPINFVISNVKPLKRDINMMVDVFAQVETMLKENPANAGIIKSIEEIKEDIEYDYLTTEIDFLLKGISEGSERTAEIVKGLRIFARVDENDLKTTNIHDGIDSTIIIVNTLLSDKITVEKNYGPVSVIECYPGKLNQTFLNIISNGIHAIKSRYGDQPGGKLTIKTWDENDQFNISIKHNGCGMPEEVGNKIFEPFYSTKDVGEGTGLGLSIAYNIVKKHNGQIVFNSKINEGTEFIITIPINQHFS